MNYAQSESLCRDPQLCRHSLVCGFASFGFWVCGVLRFWVGFGGVGSIWFCGVADVLCVGGGVCVRMVGVFCVVVGIVLCFGRWVVLVGCLLEMIGWVCGIIEGDLKIRRCSVLDAVVVTLVGSYEGLCGGDLIGSGGDGCLFNLYGIGSIIMINP